MMTRTDRRRTPILLAAIATLALAGAVLALLFSTVEAQEGSAPAKPTGLSATASHREFGIHRNTVRKYAEAKSPPMMRTRGRSRVSHSDGMTAA